MKKNVILKIAVLALIVAGTCGWASGQAAPPAQPGSAAKDETPDRAVVPLTNPAKPAKIEVSIMRGSITIRGYQGKEIIVEARTREKALMGWGPYAAGYAPFVAGATPPPPAAAAPSVKPVPAPRSGQTLKELEEAQRQLDKVQKETQDKVSKDIEARLAQQEALARKLSDQYTARAGEYYGQFFQEDKKAREEKEKKIAGMKRLSGSSSGLAVE